MPETIGVDPEARRADVREKHREVPRHPDGDDVAAHVFLAHRLAS